MKIKFTNRLYLRLILPVLCLLLISILGIITITHKGICGFINLHLHEQKHLHRENVHNLIAKIQIKLQNPGLENGPARILVQKAETVSLIESYFQQNNLAGRIIEEGREVYSIASQANHFGYLFFSPDIKDKLNFEMSYQPWHWKIIINHDTDPVVYLTRQSLQLGALLLIAMICLAAVLLHLLRKLVDRPLRTIIHDIEGGILPQYHGIYEFEYLATAITSELKYRKKTEEELRHYAETQRTIFHEVNHRVKNNLSAIVGMIYLEEDAAQEKGLTEYADFLQHITGRINGLSIVHGLLSACEWQPLPLSELCESITAGSLNALSDHRKVDVQVQPSTIKVGSTAAHHLALILNELTTNALKYGLDGKEVLKIELTFEQLADDLVKIVFRDDGPGYPAELVDGTAEFNGVGMKLIKGVLTSSLRGNMTFTNDNGALVTFTFKNVEF